MRYCNRNRNHTSKRRAQGKRRLASGIGEGESEETKGTPDEPMTLPRAFHLLFIVALRSTVRHGTAFLSSPLQYDMIRPIPRDENDTFHWLEAHTRDTGL